MTLPRRRVLQVTLALTLVVAVVGTAWWWRHPSKTFDTAYEATFETALEERVWTSLDLGYRDEADEITVSDIRPQTEQDQAKARVDFAVCRLDPVTLADMGVVGTGGGNRDDDMTRYCTRLDLLADATEPVSIGPGDDLVVGLTPTALGRTTIRDHRVDFSQGWQRGRATIHVAIDITGVTDEQAAADKAAREG